VVVVLPAVYRLAPELVLFQMNFREGGRSAHRGMENFGSRNSTKAIQDLADEVSAWNERNLIDALPVRHGIRNDALGYDRL